MQFHLLIQYVMFWKWITTNNSGILFQNRGVNFRLEDNHPNSIINKRPLHTIIPGLLTNANNETILSYGVWEVSINLLVKLMFYKIFLIIIYQEAIDFPRSFALNGELKIEKSIDDQVVEKVKKNWIIFSFVVMNAKW